MKKIIIIFVLLVFGVSSSYAVFDSKKVKELEAENASLKVENAKLKSKIKEYEDGIDKIKTALITAAENYEKELAAEEKDRKAASEKYAKQTANVKEKIEILDSSFDSDDINAYLPVVFANVKLKNTSEFDVRVMIVVEVRGKGDKWQFVYEEHNFYTNLSAGETKTLAEDFYIKSNSVKAGNGVTFSLRIEDVTIY